MGLQVCNTAEMSIQIDNLSLQMTCSHIDHTMYSHASFANIIETMPSAAFILIGAMASQLVSALRKML